MAVGQRVCLPFIFLALTCVLSHPWSPQNEGRKFGGYTIMPKACRPTIPSRIKSNEPAICMFNYECTRRNGEVVGACMDGFLFGACCRLPPKNAMNNNSNSNLSNNEQFLNLHELDHVPDIPILLNPDGTPVGVSIVSNNNETTNNDKPNVSNYHDGAETTYTKISSSNPASSSIVPSHDMMHNAEKIQVPEQPDISHLGEDFSTLLGQQNVIDDLSLPGLLTHSDSNNDIQNHQDPSVQNPITTLLRPDQILQIPDPVDQLPVLFSHGLGQNNHNAPETILLNENGTTLEEINNPDDIFRPSVETSINEEVVQNDSSPDIWIKFPEQSDTSILMPISQNSKLTTPIITKTPLVTQIYGSTHRFTDDSSKTTNTENTFEKVSTLEKKVSTKILTSINTMKIEITTPMTTSNVKDDLIKVPTIINNMPSGNKKNDFLDKEEIAINHIISILNDTTPKPEVSATLQGSSSSPIQAWVSIDETSKPSHVKLSSSNRPTTPTGSTLSYTFFKPSTHHASSSAYYNYEVVPTDATYTSYSSSNSYSSRPSTQTTYGASSSFGHSSRPTTNPPAPTVIVLGPLGTEYVTKTTQKPITRKPSTIRPILKPARPTSANVRPPISTKKPIVTTSITHNISTIISNVANNNVVSTSYISVNLKDGTSAKPIIDGSTETIVPETSTKNKPSTKKPIIWTTLSSWPNKPTFNLKPLTSNINNWPEHNLTPINTVIFKETTNVGNTNTRSTTAVPCDEETAAPDDLINFPPVRNPNLNISTPIAQQEKPTLIQTFNNSGYPDVELISEHDIPTPIFIEDEVLTNKVDAFVNKIVESLQGNFQNLKDVVYNRNSTITSSTSSTVTRKPASENTTTKKPTRKPTTKPGSQSVTTKKPSVSTKRPTSPTHRPSSAQKPTRPTKVTTVKPRPSTALNTSTKRPQTVTQRPKPTRKSTTPLPVVSSTEAVVVEEPSLSTLSATENDNAEPSIAPDFRNHCGVRPLISRAGKIVGGKGATFGEWPWQVLVREATWLGLFTKNKCGGVLITDRYVITAAHCQPGFLASLVAVFGEFDISGELESKRSVTKNVRRVIVNRGYDPATFENDLALLELESPVQFDAHIVPICMPNDGIDFTNRMATVTGWGRLKYNGGVPSVLQEVQVPIMENSVCQEMFQTAGHSKLILDSFLCAGYANGQKDSCEGDSGGPLVMERADGRWFLVGTVSHGIKCAAPYLPGVYMRTTYFKPWLHSITGV